MPGVSGLLLFDFEDLATLVVTAMGTNTVRKTHVAAVAALGEVLRFQGIVGAAAITTAFGRFLLRKGCHNLLLVSFKRGFVARLQSYSHKNPCPKAGMGIIRTGSLLVKTASRHSCEETLQ